MLLKRGKGFREWCPTKLFEGDSWMTDQESPDARAANPEFRGAWTRRTRAQWEWLRQNAVHRRSQNRIETSVMMGD